MGIATRVALAVLACAVAGPGAAAAKTATGATPVAAAVACDIVPRTVDEVLAHAVPEGTPRLAPPPLPAGTPADAATVAEITTATRLLEACLNAGDELRFLALANLDAMAIPLNDATRAELEAARLRTPTPAPPDARQQVVGPWQVQTLPDGRVLAAAAIWLPGDGFCDAIAHTKAIVWSRHDGRWLLDGMEENVETADPPGFARAIDLLGPPPTEILGPIGADCPRAEPTAPGGKHKRRKHRRNATSAAG